MILSSQLALEDVGALYLVPSCLTADPMGPLLDQDEEESLSPSSFLEGRAPASPSYASAPSPCQSFCSPFSPASPPVSPPVSPPASPCFLGSKASKDSVSFPWLSDLHTNARADVCKDPFSGMEWMAEKIDLSDFDLESLIGSCTSDESPSSPEELLATLDSYMTLDTFEPIEQDILGLSLPLPDLSSLPMELPSPVAPTDQEVVVKNEPPPSPAMSVSPPSPAYTLELGSEVDVLGEEKTPTTLAAAVLSDPSGSIHTVSTPIMVTLSPIVVVITPKDESTLVSVPSPCALSSLPSIKTSVSSSDCDSDSGIESLSGSPTQHRPLSPPQTPSSPSAGSSRTKPYSKPEPSSPSPKVKSVSGAPKVVEKKLKKMEQNKTAATRYRQKKRVEHEVLSAECSELEKRNHDLAEKADSISREIQYLKDLMEEVRNAKNRRKTSSAA